MFGQEDATCWAATNFSTYMVVTNAFSLRDDLFAHHPQSALDDAQRSTFQGLPYFAYNAEMRFIVDIDTNVEPTRLSVAMNGDESMAMTTVGRVHFVVEGEAVSLSIYWLEVYGGGLFLPF